MKGKMIRLLAWALALIMLLGVCAGIAESTDTQNVEPTICAATVAPTTTVTPVSTDEPTTTDAPVSTDEPTTTDAPVSTDEPIDTDAPVNTEEPSNTDAPVSTDEPTTTDAPVNTNEPTDTDAPVNTNEPTDTDAPVNTEEPSNTDAPVSTEEPTNTDAPVNTEEPSNTDAPVSTEEPTNTDAPENPALSGTTVAVDNSTTLADGTYSPESFSYSGGSGKTKITCNTITVSGGKVTATIIFSSASWEYVKASAGKYDARVADGKASFEIPVDLNVENRIIAMTSAMSTPKEVEYSLLVTLSETPAVTPTPEPEELEDGDYQLPIESDFKMFKILSTSAKVEGGKLIVTLRTSSASYDRIYLGAKEDADRSNVIMGTANGDGGYNFTFELPRSYMGQSVNFVPGKPDGTWYEKKQYHLTIPAALEKVEITPTPEATATPEPSETPTQEVTDGEYNAAVENNNSMFNVVSCVLKVKEGAYSATITLSGTGYDMLYIGTAETAAAADASSYIAYTPNAEGLYTFTIPVEKLDEQISIAAHAVKSGEWKDKPLTFKSEGLEAIGGAVEPMPTPEATLTPEATPTPEPSATAQPELDGSTSAVNSSTVLTDGVYTPDKFSWSGGSGRISISCSKVTVSGGKATATLVFSSKNIGYVKANGRKYYPSVSGGSSTVNIPVKLNSNNKIIGMTTAMSAAHEVTYTIYIYIQGAEESSSAATDANAPTLAGLQYESTETLEYAKLVKMYRYQGGFTMIEVEGVGRYLTVPEGAELPVGLDEDATLILLPVQSVYVADADVLQMIDGIEISEEKDVVTAIGIENPVLMRMNAAELTYAGAYDTPDYATLLKLGCDLAIMPNAFAADEAELDATLNEVRDRLELLGIPMFVDRSADEQSEEARLEWLKVYGVLLGCETEAQMCESTNVK